MKDRRFKVLKPIVIKKGEFINNFSNECKQNFSFDTVIGLDNDHVAIPKFSESDIEEMIISGFIVEVTK